MKDTAATFAIVVVVVVVVIVVAVAAGWLVGSVVLFSLTNRQLRKNTYTQSERARVELGVML